ncbi:hypothetical protein BGZ76_010644 [Entomortierella beljakovae]|nr:hypothetical protein BGZ76_010644 [Entomortierella beljakovae]
MTQSQTRGQVLNAGSPYTRQIAGILKEYPDGTQIARELLQNSDDAGSKVQWFILDHHDFSSEPNSENFRLLEKGFGQFMGPALLAGNESVFKEEDFESLRDLANSIKKSDSTKIGQMGIGFNSIYHMTDCPSFISGDGFMTIDPHHWALESDGNCRKDFFTTNQESPLFYPDQLRTFFSPEGEIDFTKPFDGTIFRFPLRTQDQARRSLISKDEYTPEMVLSMFHDLKSEALKCMLFLRNIEKITIYERMGPTKNLKMLFEIKITNADEFREMKQAVLGKLDAHLYPDPANGSNGDSELEYSIEPKFKLTQEDGTETHEQWRVSTLVGNAQMSLEAISQQINRNVDYLSDQNLVPWVGVAAPSDNTSDIGKPGLFCFLPISIPVPFPVHINGKFAVKPSRREIWTDHDGNIRLDSTTSINCKWNIHLFKTHIPKIYAKFLEQTGDVHGANYDQWPLSDGSNVGISGIWCDLLADVLKVILSDNLKVFFCDRGSRLIDYKSAWFTGTDISENPILVEALAGIDVVVTQLPKRVLELIPSTAKSLGLENRILTPKLMRTLLYNHKANWSGSVTSEVKTELLKYCLKDIQDDEVADLEGLPLLHLQMANGLSSKLTRQQAEFCSVLEYSNAGLVNVENELIKSLLRNAKFQMFWNTGINMDELALRIRLIFGRLFYNRSPSEKISFPRKEWIDAFWKMVETPFLYQSSTLFLSKLEGLPLFPLNNGAFGAVSNVYKVAYIDSTIASKISPLRPFSDVFSSSLGCSMIIDETRSWGIVAAGYVFEISDAINTVHTLSRVPDSKLASLSQDHRKIIYDYISSQLPAIIDVGLVNTLKSLPIYQTYDKLQYVSVQYPGQWRVAGNFLHSDYPWLPKTVNLLHCGYLESRNLSRNVEFPIYDERQYWYDILSQFKDYTVDQWDSIFIAFSKRYPSLRNNLHDEFQSILIGLPFVSVTSKTSQENSVHRERCTPREVVDPSLSIFFLDKDHVFPSNEYAEPFAFNALKLIGIRSSFDESFILERVKALAEDAKSIGVKEVCLPMMHIYFNIEEFLLKSQISQSAMTQLRLLPWIIAKRSGGVVQCCKPNECRPQEDRDLIQSQMPIATYLFKTSKFSDLVGWDQPLPLDKVLARFISLIKTTGSDDSVRGHALTTELAIKFYKYFSSIMDRFMAKPLMKEALNSIPWILVGDTLYATEKVTLKSSLDLRPHFAQCNLTGFNEFFLEMGVRENVEQADLQKMISDIASKYGEKSLPSQEAELIVEMLKGVANGIGYQRDPGLYVLTHDNKLCKLDNVVFDDTNARKDENLSDIIYGEKSKYIFLNDTISRDVADKIGVAMFSARYLEEVRDKGFEVWPQEVGVLDRINTFINDYNPPDIFNEFLQNAADAGATEFKFVLDKRGKDVHGDRYLLSPNMADWQGPALIIYNNAMFTEQDFKGLCAIDKGSKQNDSTTIGRHGLGFNCVYHFTDVPSVVSGSHVGFFDPQHAYLPKRRTPKGDVTQGGLKCDFTKQSGNAFSNQWQPYVGHFDCDMKSNFEGTLFRIPLRTEGLNLLGQRTGKKLGKQWKISEVENMIELWVKEAQVGMLFLEKMKCIEISVMSENVDDKTNFSWTAKKSAGIVNITLKSKFHKIDSMAEMDNATQNDDEISPRSRSGAKKEKNSTPPTDNTEDGEITKIPDFTVEARKKGAGFRASGIEIHTSSNNKTTSKTVNWMVLTCDEFPEEPPQSIIDLGNKYSWHPHIGVAIPLNNFDKSTPAFQGRIFSHLPTPMMTELPFHIHGGFALTSNRKSLAGEKFKKEEQSKWNNYLLQNCLPEIVKRAFINLLVLRFWKSQSQAEVKGAIEDYFKYWPNNNCKKTGPFVNSLFKLFNKSPVFPVLDKESQISFLKGSDIDFLSLAGLAPDGVEKIIYNYLIKIGKNISLCPTSIQTQLLNSWKSSGHSSDNLSLGYTVVNPRYILNIISQDKNFIPNNIIEFQHKRWLIGYTMRELLTSTNHTQEYLDRLNLIPLMDGAWKTLGPTSICFVAERNMTCLIDNKSQFLDKSIFDYVDGGQSNQDILKNLESPKFGIYWLSDVQFTKIFNSENPKGLSKEKGDLLYQLLRNYEDLEKFQELMILRDIDGVIHPLRLHNIIELSQIPFQLRRIVEDLSKLLQKLGFVIYNKLENLDHPYISRRVPFIGPESIIHYLVGPDSIEKLENNIKLKSQEARAIRDLIRITPVISAENFNALGGLKIWPPYITEDNNQEDDSQEDQEEYLIKAKGSWYMDGDFPLINFGDHSDVINIQMKKKILESLGVIPLDVITAVTGRIIPRFQNGSLACTGETKEAYILVMLKYCNMVLQQGKGEWAPGNISNPIVLTRNGHFMESKKLYDPNDGLIKAIFGEDQSLLPDEGLWSRIPEYQRPIFKLKSSADTEVVADCTRKLLSLIKNLDCQRDPSIPEKSRFLLNFIYDNYSSITKYNWLEVCIVPVDKSRQSPFHEKLPSFPEYMSVEQLMYLGYYEVCWTQCAFFPEALRPRGFILSRNSSIGQPNVTTVVGHLNSLVCDIADLTTTLKKQKKFATSLFATYKWLNDIAKSGSADDKSTLRDELGKIRRPYILNGRDNAPSLQSSWFWPKNLVLDIDDAGCDYVVKDSLLEYRSFLIAAGVRNQNKTEHRITKPPTRIPGSFETFLFNSFRTQDKSRGHMDIVFKFSNSQKIMAHKVILKHANELFATKFNGKWSIDATTDIDYPGMDVIEMNEEHFTFETFAGMLYFFYTGKLVREEDPIPGTHNNTNEVKVQRLKFLLELLKAAHYYGDPVLTDYIAIDILENCMGDYTSFLGIYYDACEYGSKEFEDSCVDHLIKNYTYFVDTHKLEINSCQSELDNLSEDDNAKREDLVKEISILESELKEFDRLKSHQ